MSDYDFGESLMSQQDESTTDLEDTIKDICIDDGCYIEPSEEAVEFIADEFSEDAEKKEYLRDILLDNDLIPLLCDAIAHKRDNEAQGIFNRLKGIATENLEEETKLIAEKLL